MLFEFLPLHASTLILFFSSLRKPFW